MYTLTTAFAETVYNSIQKPGTVQHCWPEEKQKVRSSSDAPSPPESGGGSPKWFCLSGRTIVLYADDILFILPSNCRLKNFYIPGICEKELHWLDMAINFKYVCVLVLIVTLFRGFRAQRFYLKKSKFFRKRVFVFCKFYFVILPTWSGNCILIFTPLESSLQVLSNCVFLKLLI